MSRPARWLGPALVSACAGGCDEGCEPDVEIIIRDHGLYVVEALVERGGQTHLYRDEAAHLECVVPLASGEVDACAWYDAAMARTDEPLEEAPAGLIDHTDCARWALRSTDFQLDLDLGDGPRAGSPVGRVLTTWRRTVYEDDCGDWGEFLTALQVLQFAGTFELDLGEQGRAHGLFYPLGGPEDEGR